MESVQLPFRTSEQLEKAKVVWEDCEDRKVHVFKNGSDRLEEQNRFYRDRTKMKRNLLRTGDLSVTLKHPTKTDSEWYVCRVFKNEDILRQKTVHLKVKGLFALGYFYCFLISVCLL